MDTCAFATGFEDPHEGDKFFPFISNYKEFLREYDKRIEDHFAEAAWRDTHDDAAFGVA